VADLALPRHHYFMSSKSQPDVAMGSDLKTARLTVAAVARRLGIAPGTLRTWDRRYELGPSEHLTGQHRRYSQEDLSRLLYMHKLVISGVSPAEAATLAKIYVIAPSFAQVPQVNLVDEDLVNYLFKAAEVFDNKSVETQIRSEISSKGTAVTWTNLLVPLLCKMGEEWERTGEGIAAEHLTTEALKRILGERVFVENPRNEVPVLLACIGEEAHSLPITALAASLAEKNIQVHLLGPRTPVQALSEIVRLCAPPAIFLWKQLSENATVESLEALPAVRPAPRVILGGPGWTEVECEGAYVARDLVAAVREISLALGL
jgi:DNA-binding transcriptional MerR regulator